MNNCKYCGAPGFASRQENCYRKPKPFKMQGELEPLPISIIDEFVHRVAIELNWKPKQSLSEKMQGELEPLPTAKKWDGDDIGEVLKHGRE